MMVSSLTMGNSGKDFLDHTFHVRLVRQHLPGNNRNRLSVEGTPFNLPAPALHLACVNFSILINHYNLSSLSGAMC